MQNIEMAQLRNEVCRCAANDVLCNDVPAAPEMMQPPQAAIVPQGTHHLSAGQHHFPQGTSFPAGNILPRKKRLPEQTFLRGVSFFYSFPHCLPVKNRRVVVARNTLPARSTVEGNSGWEGLHG